MAHPSPQFLSSAPGKCLARLFLALLALAVISGGSLAAGDLFDDDYKDCPHKTRLRDGQIADLSVNRDSDDEDEVNVSWAATDPATWGLGSNAYRTTLVVILDDGDSNTKTLSLGSKKVTFDPVETGREVTVQMAIVVDTADGKYLISDILEKSIFQSLTEPSFAGDVLRVTNKEVLAVTHKAAAPDASPALLEVPAVAGIAAKTETVANGMFYFVGYNENFGNYRARSGLVTKPTTARLRIGLRHSDEEDADARSDVDFDAYIIRIVDEDGDVVSEGDDVATVGNNYGTASLPACTTTIINCVQANSHNDAGTPNDLSDDSFGTAGSARQSYELPRKLILGNTGDTLKENKVKFSNVRVNDDGDIVRPLPAAGNVPFTLEVVDPTTLVAVRVGRLAVHDTEPATPVTEDNRNLLSWSTLDYDDATGQVYVDPPDEHRDFPIDVMASDESYTISAWAINEDDEVISPVAKLKVRKVNTNHTATAIPNIMDYLNQRDDPDAPGTNIGNAVTTVTTTEFTVLK